MRYKIIYFYLPLYYDSIGSRIHHFEIEKGSYIVTEHPGDSYNDDARDYALIKGSSGVYRVYISGGSLANWFIKIVEESDPMFNFDMAYLLGTDDELTMEHFVETYCSSLVPLFLEDKILRMHHAAVK